MSGKAGPSGAPEDHAPALQEGVATIFSWLTILPVRGAQVFDTTTGRRAMTSVPLVGLALGALAACVAALARFGVSPLLCGVLIVVGVQLSTRLMHVDGLADVADALGSYAPVERAREILGDSSTGAVGMGAVLLVIVSQIAGFSALIDAPLHSSERSLAIVSVLFISRAAALSVARSASAPLRVSFSDTGFGSLIVGTVPAWRILGWGAGYLVLLCTAAALGIVGVPVACAVGVLGCGTWLAADAWVGHLARRFGGLNGDCAGAVIELAAATMAVALPLAVGVATGSGT